MASSSTLWTPDRSTGGSIGGDCGSCRTGIDMARGFERPNGLVGFAVGRCSSTSTLDAYSRSMTGVSPPVPNGGEPLAKRRAVAPADGGRSIGECGCEVSVSAATRDAGSLDARFPPPLPARTCFSTGGTGAASGRARGLHRHMLSSVRWRMRRWRSRFSLESVWLRDGLCRLRRSRLRR